MNNILLTSAGRRVSLLRAFQKELKAIGITSKVFATDLYPEFSAACQIADGFFKVPRVTEPDYIEALLDICLNNEIKIIIPTIDTELKVLSLNKEKFKKNNITVIVSDPPLIKKSRDKRLTIELFTELGIHSPKLIDKYNPVFPVFIKPYDGSCSKDIFVVKDETMLMKSHLINDKLIFMEYLEPEDHQEYTIDLYYGKDSELKCSVPRKRIEVRSGEINKGITCKNFLVSFIKEKLNKLNGAMGCITLQVFVNLTNKEVFGIEINPRFGGGFPLSYAAGANYPEWIIREYLMGESIQYYEGWEDSLLMLRYDDEVLVHGSKSL